MKQQKTGRNVGHNSLRLIGSYTDQFLFLPIKIGNLKHKNFENSNSNSKPTSFPIENLFKNRTKFKIKNSEETRKF